MKSAEQRQRLNASRLKSPQVPDLNVAPSHDGASAALGKSAVVRLEVRLAVGETNNTSWITRSVIHLNMREQTWSTVVRHISRAFQQYFENARRSLYPSTQHSK